MTKKTKSKIYKATVRPTMVICTREKSRKIQTKENSWQNKNRQNKKLTNQRIL